MIATDFDSLTGQWGTQAPNLYVLARLNGSNGNLTVDKILDEFYQGFGSAATLVKSYFMYWKEVSDSITDVKYDKIGGNWSNFISAADKIFTSDVLNKGFDLLEKVEREDCLNLKDRKRVIFLRKGLQSARLTLNTQKAYRVYKKQGDIKDYQRAIKKLIGYRKNIEDENVSNIGYLTWAENRVWDKSVIEAMEDSGSILKDNWRFQWDPDNKGILSKWFSNNYDDSNWFNIKVNSPWESQKIGQKWKEQNGKDYDGLAWYRNCFYIKDDPSKQYKLLFGAIDEAATIWVNGTLALERPYPYKGDRFSWNKSFYVNISKYINYGKLNFIAIRVEDNSGAGGIFKPVWLIEME